MTHGITTGWVLFLLSAVFITPALAQEITPDIQVIEEQQDALIEEQQNVLIEGPDISNNIVNDETDGFVDSSVIESPDDSVQSELVNESSVSASQSMADINNELSREMLQMRRDIADINRFSQRQSELQRIGRTSPDEALLQRLPMQDCLDSVLKPLCSYMTGLFKPET